MSVFEEFFGKPKPSVDPSIAASVWMEKTPIFTKLPKADEETIKIKSGDFKRVIAQAFKAGFERAQQ